MIDDILDRSTAAKTAAPPPGDDAYPAYCDELARQLEKRWGQVLAANRADVEVAAARGLPGPLVDRLTLVDAHLAALTRLTAVVRDALGVATRPQQVTTLPSGVRVQRVPKAIGSILMIYEARPTVTVEGALLPVAVGNSVILRGGREMAATNAALGDAATEAVAAAGLPPGMVQVLVDGDRSVLRALLGRGDAIDLLIPRGSPSLIDYCRTASRIPVVASGGGVNHLYVHRSADLELATAIAVDSKVTEPTACNTLEMILADREVAVELAVMMLRQPGDAAAPLRLKVAAELLEPLAAAGAAAEPLAAHDDGREFLDRTVGLRPVDGPPAAAAHIQRYGSQHTEGIVARDPEVTDWYRRTVDAAVLVVNGSLRLNDGPTMGRGPELSISTGRLHVRGPVGLSDLLTYSWVIDGGGCLRGTDPEVPR
ncbi:MAG TPA: glutamate-5-semialdehyde dehydrogenase [Micromonosporaceae bacterium]|nr:glutamate-5-semialdehyde dehydrogenase [Micromonosporaceae bacterium]